MTRPRITKKQLESLVKYINELTGNPNEPYTRDESGKYTANIGNYHLDGAYVGWRLVQMVNESGAITNVLSSGYIPKRQLFNELHAFIQGINTSKQ